jgi:hypothetical protein
VSVRLRPAALVLAAALLAGACGGGRAEDAGPSRYGDPDGAFRRTTTTDAGGDEDDGDRRGPTTTARAASDGGGASRPAATTAPRTGGRGGGGASASRPVTVGGPPGSYARPILRASEGGTVVLDLLVQAGAELRQDTVDHALDVLRRESDKDVSLSVTEIPGTSREWTSDALIATADERSPNDATSDRHVIHLLAVNGSYEEAAALGVAVRGDVAAVFTDQVRGASTPLVPARVIEAAVTVHEIGHLLGLVDLALATGRADPDHPGHSRNRGSVMYWAIESNVVAQVLGGPPATDFDADDRADLARLRSGA